MMQFGLIGIGAGAAAALLFASVTSGVLAVDPAVLSRAAADHDRRARLEPLGGLDRRARRRARARPRVRPGVLLLVSWPAPGCRPGGSAISRCWRAPPATARPRSNGIRLAGWWSGRPCSAPWWWSSPSPISAIDAESFRAGLRHALTHILRVETDAPADAPLSMPGVSNAEPADRLPGDRHSAGGGGARHHHQRAQSVARRRDREVFRPAAAAVAAACGDDVSARADRRRSRSPSALSFVGSLIGIVAGVLSASLLMAYGVLGFAVLHAITRGMASRIFVLARRLRRGARAAAGRCWRSACSA